MIRFLLFLLNKKGYENCKGCEVLREQLLIANEEKQLAINTLLDIMKPKVAEPIQTQSTPVLAGPMPWARRRAILEEQERIKAQRMKTSSVLAKSDKQLNDEMKKTSQFISPVSNESIEKLERELGLDDTNSEKTDTAEEVEREKIQ